MMPFRRIATGAILLLPSCSAEHGLPADGSAGDSSCGAANGVLEIGRLDQGVFIPFADDANVAVVHGLQGGTWIMPSLRLTDGQSVGDMDAALRLSDASLVGEIRRPNLHFVSAPETSALVLQFLPVPVSNAPGTPSLDTVDGAQAILSLSYRGACGPAIEADFSMTLTVSLP